MSHEEPAIFGSLFPLNTENLAPKRKYEYISAFQEHGAEENENNKINDQTLLPTFKVLLNTPEEIEEWIKQRKRNYPTEANIKKKKLVKLDKEISEIQGEGLVASYTSSDASNSEPEPDSDSGSESDDSADSSNLESETDLPEVLSSKIKVKAPLKPEKIPHDEPRTKRIVCKYFQRGRCNRGDNCLFHHPQASKISEVAGSGTEKETQQRGLLEMLLQRDITLENTHILQCLNYFSKAKMV